ncbi:aldo/keto reductase, partial [Xanthomonas arboricola]|uniref:aldo/keto reductase n=1 Tax=Xanthomonas arboricola TaxID=56448 RepID=UPI002157D916
MQYRRLGSTGLQLSALSFGAWVTFGKQIGRSEARNLIAAAWDNGINFFDNAEVYARGRAEEHLARHAVTIARQAQVGDHIAHHF